MADAIKFRCKGCEKKISVRAEYAGKKAKCPGCKQPLRVPSPRPKRSASGTPVTSGATASSSSSSASGISLADLVAMEASADAQIKELSHKASSRPSSIRIEGGKDCPQCGSSCKPDAVLCVHCGHNYESGKTLKTKKVKAKRDRRGRNERSTGYAVEQGGWTRILYLLYGVPFTLAGLLILVVSLLLGGAAASGAAAEGEGSIIAGSSFLLALIGGGCLFSGVSLVWLGVQLRVDYSSTLIRFMCLGGGLPLSLIGGFLLVMPGIVLYMGGDVGPRALIDCVIGLFVLPAGVKLLVNGVRGSG